ncbi:MAG: hypothetical protein IKO80_08475 [Lachnospiraceae bacterium]|nr:hypothetical protein [Lachnospiraceae bacterium]
MSDDRQADAGSAGIPGLSVLRLHAPCGNHHLRLSLSANHDADPAEVWIYLNDALAACIPSFKGACELTGTLHAGGEAPCLTVTMYAPSLLLSEFRMIETGVPTVYIAGRQAPPVPASFPHKPSANPCYWGRMLPLFLTDRIAVACHPVRGEEFTLPEDLQPGDFVFLDIAIPDPMPESFDEKKCRARLETAVRLVRERDALPVLVTPLAVNHRVNDIFVDILSGYANAVVAVGERDRVPVLDLHARSSSALRLRDETQARALFVPEEVSLTNDPGAFLAARLIASEIRRILGWKEGGYQTLAAAVDTASLKDGSLTEKMLLYADV